MLARGTLTRHGPAKMAVVAPTDAPECLWIASRFVGHSGGGGSDGEDFGALVDAVLAEMERADGIVRFGVLAQPWRRRYLTASVWRDRAAVDAWLPSPAHSGAMASSFAGPPEGGGPGFIHWSAPDGKLRWGEVLRRFRAAG